MRCANPAHGTFAADDGPSIYYDAGGTDLYAASADSDPRGGCADGYTSLEIATPDNPEAPHVR
jgi:hypothetical protein